MATIEPSDEHERNRTTMNKKNSASIKETVRKKYAQLVTSEGQGSCCDCSASCCESLSGSKGTLVKKAGYSAEELAALPAGAVENSFGCGNPLAFSGVKDGQTVLDLGSGAGIDCFIASERVGKSGKVIGLDMTEAMIEKAESNAREGGFSNVEFRLGEMESMPVDDRSVDWIISNCVINLSPDKKRVFAEMYRVLKSGGRFSISDIVLGDSLPDLITENMDAWTGCIAGAIKEMEYLEGLRQAGFKDVRVAERLPYEAGVIRSLLASYAPEMLASFPEDVLDSLDGNIWSARIMGSK